MAQRNSSVARRAAVALATAGLAASAVFVVERVSLGETQDAVFDPLLSPAGAACRPTSGGQPAVLKTLILARSEVAPFQPAPTQAAGGDVPLYKNLGKLSFRISAKKPEAQAYFDQGLRLLMAFNHAEAQRSFQAAQRADPSCAMCYWGEALVLGPNINAPMMPEAIAPAVAALERASALKPGTFARERALIDALEKRYSADPRADRAALDAAYADAMKAAAARFPRDDTIQTLYAEAAMDTQPWDYWEAGGTKPKGRGADIVRTLEEVLQRNPTHPHAVHLYIHAVEASNRIDKALPYATRLGAQMRGAGHMVHMPSHIYYRLGMYRESLAANKKAIQADESYFETSPSDPMYRSAYYPHNIHFLMVSAQMGGDGTTALEAATKLDAVVPAEVVKAFPGLQPIKAAPYTTHAQFSDPARVLALPAPAEDLILVKAMYHYSRAVAYAARSDVASAQREIGVLAAMESTADFTPFEAWNVPAKEIVQTARHVATGRLADAQGDLDGAVHAYKSAIALEDALAYMEPSYWYYPVRQSLGAVLLRQGKLDEAEQAFRDSLFRVRNNGWALAGLVEVYRLKGEARAEQAAREAYKGTWFGPAEGPDLRRL